MPKCSVCMHPKRAAIDKALVAGESFRRVAAQFGASATSLRRHQKAHLIDVIQRAERNHVAKVEGFVVAQEQRRDAGALDVDEELRRIFHHMKKLLSACDDWLTDPENPSVYNLDPRGHEVNVIYEEIDDTRDRPIVLRRKAKLSQLIAKIEAGIPNTTVVNVEYKHTDPRKLIVDTANALRPSVELLAKLVDRLPDGPNVQIQINSMEIVRP